MPRPLDTTIEILSHTRNEAVVPVLVATLETSGEAVFEGALKSLVKRRNKLGHLAVLKRWHKLNERQRDLVDEGQGRMGGALRDAVLSEDNQLFGNACEVAIRFSEFDLVSTLVTLAENEKSPHSTAATELVLALTNRLSELVHTPRDYKDRRDPKRIRRFVLESLERSIERFKRHKRAELLEAFVILGGATSGLFRRILDTPHHVCYQPIVEMLKEGTSTTVTDVLIDSLQAETVPRIILSIVSNREDKVFAGCLMRFASGELTKRARKNLGTIQSFAWLQPPVQAVRRVDEEDQAQCIGLVALSGMKQHQVLDVIEGMLKTGTPEGRMAACEALSTIDDARADQLILSTMKNDLPEVQAAVVRQLKKRKIPGTMSKLVTLLDSPHAEVQDAARGALSDFSFENFLNRFELLPESARISTGQLVRKVDPDALSSLAEEFESKSRNGRLRAIAIVECMRVVPEMSGLVVELLEDSDHMVRAAAAEVLQHAKSAEVVEALQRAGQDKSAAVKYAAINSLEIIAEATGVHSSTEAPARGAPATETQS